MKKHIRVMKWIPRVELGCPGCAHVLPFAKRPLPPGRIFAVVSPGHRLQVKQFGKRGPDDPITVISKSQAEIDIIKSDMEISFIQSANFKEYRAPDCGACAG